MTKSNAERQAEYRARHLKSEEGGSERLNLMIDLHAKRALERVAICYCVTQKALLEQLLVQSEQLALNEARAHTNGQEEYYAGRLRLGPKAVTL